jgi:hypothetical protein
VGVAAGKHVHLEVYSRCLTMRPRQDSNLRSRLRRAVLYPLSYGGPGEIEGISGALATHNLTKPSLSG